MKKMLSNLKIKRSRMKKTKRWTIPEERTLVDYLLEKSEFETPTAQIYYSRFIKEKKIEADWVMVRSKVRNMRVNFAKAKAWKDTAHAANMDEEKIKINLYHMCNFYDEFIEIFGVNDCVGLKPNKSSDPLNILKTFSMNEESPQAIVTNESASLESCTENDTLNHIKFEIDEFATESECSVVENANVATHNFNGIYRGKTVYDISQIQAEMEQMKQKMSQDYAIRERELRIREKELEIRVKEIELREKELMSQETLKILELEMKERIAMEEIKHKRQRKCIFVKKK